MIVLKSCSTSERRDCTINFEGSLQRGDLNLPVIIENRLSVPTKYLSASKNDAEAFLKNLLRTRRQTM